MTILPLLREHTRTVHQELEMSLDIVRRLSSHADRIAVLRAFYGLYEPAERALELALGPIKRLGLSARRKTPVLRRDLEDLGVDQFTLRDLPCASPPAFRGTSHALGFAYVLEGATLGGRVIRKQLRRSGISLVGTNFFDVYGDDTPSRWREFCDVLETECTEPELAVAGALDGFAFVGAGLESGLASARVPIRRVSRNDGRTPFRIPAA